MNWKWLLLSSQVSPVHPSAQSHVKEATPSVHVPLFLHGFGWQLSISVLRKNRKSPICFLRIMNLWFHFIIWNEFSNGKIKLLHTYFAVVAGIAQSAFTGVRCNAVNACWAMLTFVWLTIIDIFSVKIKF